MALPARPSFEDIWTEFAVNTRPSKPASFRNDIYIPIFGGSGSGGRTSDFGGTGKSQADSLQASFVESDSAILNGSVTTQGLDTSWYFEWGAGNFNNSTPLRSMSANQDAVVEENITGLDPDTQYQFRIRSYNGFNSNVNDHADGGMLNFTTEQDLESTPYSLILTQPSGMSGEVLAEWSIDYTNLELQIEWEKNNAFDTYETLVAGTTSRTRTYSDGDFVRFRVRYTEIGNTNATTSWSNWSTQLNVNIFT